MPLPRCLHLCRSLRLICSGTFFPDQLFVEYDGAGMGGSCFRLSLGLLVDCLNIFSALGQVATVEVWYPSPNMRLLLKYVLYDALWCWFLLVNVSLHPRFLEPEQNCCARGLTWY